MWALVKNWILLHSDFFTYGSIKVKIWSGNAGKNRRNTHIKKFQTEHYLLDDTFDKFKFMINTASSDDDIKDSVDEIEFDEIEL